MATEDPAINMYLRYYKDGARKRNIEFNLTPDEFSNLISKNCYYCGAEPRTHELVSKSLANKKYILVANGIDRFDNNEGYNTSNCVPCCTLCNTMKSNLSYNNFKEHITKIYNHTILEKGSTTISEESTPK